jgi:PKD repeat protein
LLTASAAWTLQGAIYEVGPGKPYASIGAAPLSSLQPGDTVLIYYRSTPYKEKFVICRQGTAAAPITISGVPGPAGELPVIEGIGAVTAPGQNYWSENRGIVKIGGANIPADTMPRFIVIENLEIRGARSTHTFTDDGGATVAYAANASTIYIEKCEDCTIRNNILHDAGNIFFVASSNAAASRNIVVEKNRIYDGGNVGSIYEHNIYTAAIGIRFEGNWLGPLLAGAGGNNLKDRSAGTVIRYNWIESGNRQLDLVDGEDSSLIRSDAAYRSTHVYGNILIEPDGAGNRQILHYGGDSGTTANYRKGTLYFYNNTIVSKRTDRTTLFRASTNEETVDARNNIFYATAAGTTVSLADDSGVFFLSRNWIKPGWVNSFGTFSGTVNNDGTMVTGSAPGFVDELGQDYHLAAGSACIDTGGNLNGAVLPANNVTLQYVKHQSTEARPVSGAFDIGAYEYASGGGGGNTPPVASFTATPASGTVPLTVNFSAAGSSDAEGPIASYAWDFGDGGTAAGMIVSHTYNSTGTFTALLRVTDSGNLTASTTRTITVNPLAAPVLTGTASGLNVNLSWNAVSGATSYQVERRIKNGAWTPIGTVTGTTFATSGPAGNVSFRVRAANAVAVSPYSNTLTFRLR